MTEDIDFVNWLASGYNNSGLDWDHENYESEACRRYRDNDVVYLVWQDATKPGNVDFMLCKNWQFLWGRPSTASSPASRRRARETALGGVMRSGLERSSNLDCLYRRLRYDAVAITNRSRVSSYS